MKHSKRKFNSGNILMQACLIVAMLAMLGKAQAQNVGINNPTPNPKALLDLTSSDKGVLTPRMTQAQKLAMFPAPDASAKGMLIYQTDAVEGFYSYDGSSWNFLATDKKSWTLNGNTGTNPNFDFMGTTDYNAVIFRANNTEVMRLQPDGHVGINAAATSLQLFARTNEVNNGVSGIQNTHAGGYTDQWFYGSDGQMKGYIGFANPSAPVLPGLFYTGTNVNLPYVLATANVERMRITGNGNIGVGTSNPAAKFHIASNSGTGFQNIKITEAGDDYTRIGLYNDSTSNYFEIVAKPSNVDTTAFYHIYHNMRGNLFTIKGDGKIGISNSNPAAQLSFPSTLGDKITLWGGYGNMFGLGIQYSLMQLYTANANDDIAFGYGTSGNFTERMRVKGNGNVGIGTSAPVTKLHVVSASVVPVNIQNTAAGGYSGLHLSDNTGALAGHFGYANASAATFANQVYAGSIAPVPFVLTTANIEKMRIDPNGNVGIGTSTPGFPLSFNNNMGDKIALWGVSGNHCGFGVQNNLMQMHTMSAYDDIAFGYGNSAAMTETVRIKGNGNVGIGTSAPSAKLEVNGFTKLGASAPAIKTLKLTGTTSNYQGGTVTVAHGLTDINKILSIDVLVDYGGGAIVHHTYTQSAGYEFNFYVGATTVFVVTKAANSANILSRPYRVFITYEE